MNIKILLLLIILAPALTYTQNKCNVSYIANEGFLISIDKKKVLIDALFGNINGNWCDQPSDSLLNEIIIGNNPYNEVDILAITHKHRDHFKDSIVIRYLIHNPNVVVVCPNQVNQDLKQHSQYSKIKNKIYSITPPVLNDSTISINGIEIKILRLEHSHYMEEDKNTGEKTNKHANIENIGFLFDFKSAKIFHCGDTNPLNEDEYKNFALNEADIDIALLERLFFARGEAGLSIIDDYISPKNIIMMHINPANLNAFLSFLPQLKSKYPNIDILHNKNKTAIFSF